MIEALFHPREPSQIDDDVRSTNIGSPLNESTTMKSTLGSIAVIAFGLLNVVEIDGAESNTPKQQYTANFREYSLVSGGLRKATTDLDRKAAVEALAPFAPMFLELAEQHPTDPVALTALRQAIQVDVSTDSAAQNTWEMNSSNFPSGSMDGAAAKAVTLVLRDHLRSENLGPVIDRMRYGYRMDYDRGLSTILEKNPHRDVQGLACLALAQFLSDRLRMLRLVEDRAELAECYEIVFGKEYLPELQRLGQAKLASRIETLFERAANEYAEVKFRNGTVGETAKSELYDIRFLSVGNTAPEIAGQDQDGVQFKLTDYRGKVVLLYFWSEF